MLPEKTHLIYGVIGSEGKEQNAIRSPITKSAVFVTRHRS